ncbi:MAG: sigma-E factor regulatory protein RseB domain-containing protein, partial [Acidimicrobiales bacterium]
MTARTARVARATGTRRGLVAVTVVLAAGPLVVWPPFGTAAAGPADNADTAGPVEAVRSTARSVSFSARVDVEWVDGQGRHSASLDVRAGNGLVRVAGAGSAPQAGSAGALVLGDGWLVFTRPGPGTAPASLPPALEAKYDVERLPGPLVAGRPTDLVVLRTGARIRERLAIDTESGLVLRREMFGPADRPVRTVTVTDLDTSAPKTPKVVAPRAAEAAEKPVAPGELRAAYQMPAELAGGYHRVGTFRRDRVVHVVYSDG